MAYRAVGDPFGDNFLSNRHNNYYWSEWSTRYPDRGHARSAPAELPYIEYDPGLRRWTQGNKVLSSSFKPKKYWARPVDGKRRGALGRLKDGLTGEGPDVFAVLNGDRRTLHRDLPHRAQWSNWDGPNHNPNWLSWWYGEDMDETRGEHWHGDAPWADQGAKRYNFRNRKYQGPARQHLDALRGKLWSDAYWREGAKRNDKNPLSKKDHWGQAWTRVPYWQAYMYPGGREGTI
ncbi:hypothetical protein LTR37_013312 [Vermiconidia calcicola]|uniref:Uncharacterized protein n=1 Tax=Vermiconidia calcicola TaxID=1690605 RepID=A0ACC3MX25_9PEZI|nr:hypothetical protein LTR37_013312 [Vermiconidia calcicola]